MDDVLFGAKRAHWAAVRFSARKLKPYGITPARVMLLRVMHSVPFGEVSQQYVVHHLGVARSVVSRMMRALEELGLVERGGRDELDRRTRICRLTERGRQLVARVWSELVHSRIVAREIDAIWPEPHVKRGFADVIFAGLALSFGRWGPLCVP